MSRTVRQAGRTSEGVDRRAIRTVGHGTLTEAAFLAVLERGGVDTVADVRRHPGSRRHPQFGRDAMAAWLAGAGVAYEWFPDLGGRRRPAPDSPNGGLRNEQFRGYADHMATPEFAGAVDRLLALPGTPAVMCAETLWWRCHRRLLADHLVLVRGVDVLHLLPDADPAPHRPTDGAAVDLAGALRYG
jgi:uncharacterized protein (DUF488 family)